MKYLISEEQYAKLISSLETTLNEISQDEMDVVCNVEVKLIEEEEGQKYPGLLYDIFIYLKKDSVKRFNEIGKINLGRSVKHKFSDILESWFLLEKHQFYFTIIVKDCV